MRKKKIISCLLSISVIVSNIAGSISLASSSYTNANSIDNSAVSLQQDVGNIPVRRQKSFNHLLNISRGGNMNRIAAGMTVNSASSSFNSFGNGMLRQKIPRTSLSNRWTPVDSFVIHKI